MGAPHTGLSIEWIVRGSTTRYEQKEFQPCAVICKDCSLDQNIRGNIYSGFYGNLQLFIHP